MRQEYTYQPLFPVNCYTFRAPAGLAENALKKAKDLEYKSFNPPGGVGTSDDITTNKDFHYLHRWFQECSDTLHCDNGWNCDRLVVNKSWVNRSDARTGEHHMPHRHPMSYLSGVFYLTEGPPTVLVDPLAQREWAQFHLDGDVHTREVGVHPGPGGLFLFPSYMVHGSITNTSEHDRYTIAFNTFPSGQVNSGGWDRSMVDVAVKGWDDNLGALRLDEYGRD